MPHLVSHSGTGDELKRAICPRLLGSSHLALFFLSLTLSREATENAVGKLGDKCNDVKALSSVVPILKGPARSYMTVALDPKTR